MKTKKGFTLIELLIVIAIIGILAVALMPTIYNAPGKARDKARLLNISALATAVEAFNSEDGKYPAEGTNGCIDGTNGPFAGVAARFFSGGDRGIPTDPSGAGRSTGDTNCIDLGFYNYSEIDPAYGQYAIWTIMEIDENNNAGAAPPATNDPMTACATTFCVLRKPSSCLFCLIYAKIYRLFKEYIEAKIWKKQKQTNFHGLLRDF
jgi:prepilin-type N-terminal cleavage/methylation domain-containing protein